MDAGPLTPRFIAGPDGLRLATWDFGGAGPDLLLVHATGFHARCYRAMADCLTATHHVHAVDLRGHGSSAAPAIAADADGRFPMMAWPLFADDVLAAVDALGLDHPVAFGHSSGGATLLLAEAQRPGTFPAITAFEPVVFDPALRPPGIPMNENPLAAGARRRRAWFASLDAARANFAAKPPLHSLRADVLADYVAGGFAPASEGGGVVLRCAPEVEAATYDMASLSGAWDAAPSVAAPVRVVCGGPTGHFQIDVAQAVAARVQHGEAIEVAHLSHFGPLEAPDEVAALVVRADH